MKNTKIIHIDYGTKGNSGFYLEQILLNYSGTHSIDAYVHSEYNGEFGKARVFKIFDLLSKYIPWKTGRNIYKFLDIYFVFFIIYLRTLAERSRNNIVLFISLFQSFHAYELFLHSMSKHAKIIITVHDAIEHHHSYPKWIMSYRDNILKSADHLIVHGRESTQLLSYLDKPISEIPFPLMRATRTSKIGKNCQVNFLYIGHIRVEKGVDILVKAWRKYCISGNDVALTIAGTVSCALEIDFKNLKNCTTILGYIDDNTFVNLILDADYVILPYIGGTNSGVFSVATSLIRPCITSCIPLFTQSPFSIESLRYPGGVESLANILDLTVRNHSQKYSVYQKFLESQIDSYQKVFKNTLNHVYDQIMLATE